LQPIWHPKRGRPFTEGFRVRLRAARRREVASTFTAVYFGDQAQAASTRLMQRELLKPGEAYRFIVAAYPREERGGQAPPRFEAEDASADPPLRHGVLAERLHGAAPRGESIADDIPVFIPQAVLQETAELARRAGAVECGGILVGYLHRDSGAGEMYASITAQIPAVHAQGDRTSLKFTHESWDHVKGLLDLRRRNEMMLGWWHSHPVHAWCGACPIESRRRCPLSTGFFSSHDRALHRTVFSRAWGLGLVVNDNGDGAPTHSLFGWRHGLLQPRGYHVVEAATT
jgi:proteasome lid subunit RPN8/RPN11